MIYCSAISCIAIQCDHIILLPYNSNVYLRPLLQSAALLGVVTCRNINKQDFNFMKWRSTGVRRQVEHHNCRNRKRFMHRNRNPCSRYFLVNMARGIDRGRVRLTTTTTTTTTLLNMAAILLLIPSLGLQLASDI